MILFILQDAMNIYFSQAAANQIIVCRAAIEKQKRKEKQLYANMFDKFAKHDNEVTGSRSLDIYFSVAYLFLFYIGVKLIWAPAASMISQPSVLAFCFCATISFLKITGLLCRRVCLRLIL